MTYIRFKEHEFEIAPPEEYDKLISGHTYEDSLIEDTWYLDKPVSRVYREPDTEFVELLKEIFHVFIDDGYETEGGEVAVYFSRLPELPEVTANLDTPAEGILFGFPARDVASYIERHDGSVK